MGELQEEVGTEWVYTYAPELDTHTLGEAFQNAQKESRSGKAPLDDRSWDTLARQTVDLYERVLAA